MITLTKISKSDKDYFMRLNNDIDTLYWMESDEPYDDDLFYQIVSYPMVTWYIIRDKSTKVGLFTTYSVNDKLFAGIIIDKKYRRQGYARKAFETYIKATDSLGVDLYLSCFIDQPAIGLYKELGFIPTGYEKLVRGRTFIEMRRKFNP